MIMDDAALQTHIKHENNSGENVRHVLPDESQAEKEKREKWKDVIEQVKKKRKGKEKAVLIQCSKAVPIKKSLPPWLLAPKV